MRLFMPRNLLWPGHRFRFGGGAQRSGYIELSSGDVVSWCYGHLLENLKRRSTTESGRLGSLHASDHGERWRLKRANGRRKQLKVLACLSAGKGGRQCGRPNREGQLLVDEVWNTTLERKDARLLLNATDSASVRRR